MTTTYTYLGWDRSTGQAVSGTTNAQTAEAARLALRENHIIVSASNIDTLGGPSFMNKTYRFRSTLKTKEKADLWHNLATYQHSGLTLKIAISTLANQNRGKLLGEVLTDVSTRIDSGEHLSAALGAHKRIFTLSEVSLIEAGEKSGKLDEIFERLSETTMAQDAIRRKLKSASRYPIVVLGFSLALAMAMLMFVVPTLQNLYTSLNGSLPAPTQVMVSLSEIIRHDWFWGILGVVVAGLVFNRWRRAERNRALVDNLKGHMPLVGRLVTKAAVARVTSTLATMLSSGVTILVAIDHAGEAAGLTQLRLALQSAGDEVKKGRRFSHGLQQSPLWPDILYQIVKLGEDTGRVDDMLTRFSKQMDQEVQDAADALGDMLQPIMLVLVGGLVALMLIGLYLPMFDMVKLIK
jgi:type IV pilus assembly protein PilC